MSVHSVCVCVYGGGGGIYLVETVSWKCMSWNNKEDHFFYVYEVSLLLLILSHSTIMCKESNTDQQ
jgi:hypothetical protein